MDADGLADGLTDERLERAFADVAAGVGSVRGRVMARIDPSAPLGTGADDPSTPRSLRSRVAQDARSRSHPLPLLGRRRRLIFLVHAAAAALLLTAYAGYLALIPIQRQALAIETRTGVRNLAIVLRTLKERAGGADVPLAAALERLRLERDPFGNAYAYDAASHRVYSFGVDGRDDGGSGDDIVAYAR